MPPRPANARAAAEVALAGAVAALVPLAWIRPEALTPAALLLAAAAALLGYAPDGRRLGRATLAATGLGLLLWLKDATPSPLATAWAWTGELPGALPPTAARQPDPWRAVGHALQLTALVWLAAMAPALLGRPRVRLVWAHLIAFGGAGLAVWLWWQPHPLATLGNGFSLGTVGSRNAAGAALALTAITAAALFLAAARRRAGNHAVLLAAAAGVAGAVAVSLGSRGAALALLAGVVVLAWPAPGTDATARGRGLAALALVAFAVLLVAPPTVARFTGMAGDFRLELWREALRVGWLAPWGGLGLGQFAASFALHGGLTPPLGATFTHPDSSWVLLVVELGGAGLAALGAAAWCAWHGGGTRSRLAAAGLAVWMVAGLGDIALHRPALLAIAWPFLGLALAGAPHPAPTRLPRAAASLVALLLAVLGALTFRPPASPALAAGYRIDGSGLVLTAEAARALHRRPLDPALHHALGGSALGHGAPALAARHFEAVAARHPAHERANGLMAHAVHTIDPAAAAALWRHLFDHAAERVYRLLHESRRAFPATPPVYWRRVIAGRPEAEVVLADTPSPAAQRAFDRWRALPVATRRLVPLDLAAPAFARWGSPADLAAWLDQAPPRPLATDASIARGWREQGRDDLAWLLLARALPPTPPPVGDPTAAPVVDPALARRVNPRDARAAALLLADPALPAERALGLLRDVAADPAAPVWFEIALAHRLAAAGATGEALNRLLAAARRRETPR